MRANIRKFLIGLIVLAILVALAIHSRHRIHLGDFTWRKFVHAVSEANWLLLFLSLVGIYGCYAIRAVRWQRFARYTTKAGFLATFSGTLMGFASIFLLARFGEPVRPLLLARKTKAPVASMFGIWVLERLFDFASAVVLAAISILAFSGKLSDSGADTDTLDRAKAGGWVLVGLLVALIALLIYFRLHGAGELHKRLEAWRHGTGWRKMVAGAIGGFSDGLQAIRSVTDLVLAITYSAAHWICVALLFLMVARAFGSAFLHSTMDFPGAIVLLAITLVGSTLQLPGVGGGPQIASFIALTTIFGVASEPATAIAMVLWIISFAACILVGIPLLIHEGFSLGDLWRLARTEAKAEDVGTHVPIKQVIDAPHHGTHPEKGSHK
jgi:glycosyltransferase 2 family protein